MSELSDTDSAHNSDLSYDLAVAQQIIDKEEYCQSGQEKVGLTNTERSRYYQIGLCLYERNTKSKKESKKEAQFMESQKNKLMHIEHYSQESNDDEKEYYNAKTQQNTTNAVRIDWVQCETVYKIDNSEPIQQR